MVIVIVIVSFEFVYPRRAVAYIIIFLKFVMTAFMSKSDLSQVVGFLFHFLGFLT